MNEDLEHGLGDPRHRDVRVGVVLQPALFGAGVLLVELVRAHHPVDLIAVTLRVVGGNRGPEARDPSIISAP
jgi:hypothetical protein